jgi:hypothetical protein
MEVRRYWAVVRPLRRRRWRRKWMSLINPVGSWVMRGHLRQLKMG